MSEAYILLKVTPGYERQIFQNLQSFEEVKDINELYGEWDIIIKVEVDRLEDLDALLSGKIRMIDGIKITSTMIVANYKR